MLVRKGLKGRTTLTFVNHNPAFAKSSCRSFPFLLFFCLFWQSQEITIFMLTKETASTLPIDGLPIDRELKEALRALGCESVGEVLEKYTAGQLSKAPCFGIGNFKNFIQFLEDNNLADQLVER